MGYTIEITCKECNYRKICNLGRSMKKEKLEEVLARQGNEVASAVSQMGKAYAIKDYEYGKQLMLCKSCHDISEQELLIIEFQDAQDYIVSKYCSKCSNLLKILDMDSIEHARCPKCLKYGLKYRHICSWK